MNYLFEVSNIFYFLREAGGGLFLKFLQVILDDESWSLKAKVFSQRSIFTTKSPWVSNTAIAKLLFKSNNKFQRYFPQCSQTNC